MHARATRHCVVDSHTHTNGSAIDFPRDAFGVGAHVCTHTHTRARGGRALRFCPRDRRKFASIREKEKETWGEKKGA